ncbi:MAG: 2-C-methyl-D-erythritol 4-phosphate cytidylyltransferase [Eubacteriales bacterium]
MIKLLKKFGRKEKQKECICSVIVPAAGNASRMEGIDKILVEIGGKPILAHTLEALNQCDLVHEIIIVTREDLIVDLGKLCKEFEIDKASKILVGGKTRRDSVLIGVGEVRENANIIGIHDGARPFLSQNVLKAVLLAGERSGAAAPAIPVTDTIKLAKDGLVEKTLDRDRLFAVQTPQVFESSLIQAALAKAVEENVPLTDDCSAVERLGMKVTLTEGDRRNIKITTPLDLTIAKSLLEEM